MPQRFDIAIIIVSYNCMDSLKECLESIDIQSGVSHKIIVIDNASSDGTREFLEKKEFKKILLAYNIGFGAAANLGAGQAESKYLFILNPDTILPAGTLKALFDFAEGRDDIGLISPMLVYPDGAAQLSARNLPGRFGFLLGRGSPLYKLGLTGEKEAGYITPMGSEPLIVPAISATALFVRADLFNELGGFDQRFFMYMEDIDLCRRVAEKGLKICLLPSVIVKHAWRRSSSRRPYFASYRHHVSIYKYFRKHYPRQITRNLIFALALGGGFMLSSIMIFLKGRRHG